MKKSILSTALALTLCLPSLALFSGCSQKDTIVLRVYNWEEYIDEGGEESYYDPEANHMATDFELWYKETYEKDVRVEYSKFGTNEDLYNQLKLGDKYDLICPSEYMIMKLAAEGMLEPYSAEFFDETNDKNYYIRNVSPFIKDVFENGKVTIGEEVHSWSEYAAGYMWGTTGLVYNPETVSEEDLEQGWSIMLDEKFKGRVTTKDNVRDSYFVGLGIYYRDELLSLDKNAADYNERVTEIMNRTDEASIAGVQDVLLRMKQNIFGFETDTGKKDMVTGKIDINFAWGGDAVYAMDEAEGDEKTPEDERVYLNYYIPEESSNLFFDGWAIPKDENRSEDVKKAAEAFVNFMSIPENAVRNMDYIGYASVIAGDEEHSEIRDYIDDTYASDDEDDMVPYDLSYFFGLEDGSVVIDTFSDQLQRQLYAQFPPKEVMTHCAVMDYYGSAEEGINELWTKIKGEALDAWAIAVIAVTAAAIIVVFLLKKVGEKIKIPRKHKQGYALVKQEKI